MGKESRYKEEKDWPLEGYYRSQLKSMEAHAKWVWKEGYFPEIGWLWSLTKIALRVVTYPLRFVLRFQRKQKRLKEFRTFIRGEEQR